MGDLCCTSGPDNATAIVHTTHDPASASHATAAADDDAAAAADDNSTASDADDGAGTGSQHDGDAAGDAACSPAGDCETRGRPMANLRGPARRVLCILAIWSDIRPDATRVDAVAPAAAVDWCGRLGVSGCQSKVHCEQRTSVCDRIAGTIFLGL